MSSSALPPENRDDQRATPGDTRSPAFQSSLRIFRVLGTDVYLHWSWFVAAYFLIQAHSGYSSIVWNIAEYLAVFALVLLHEFGHVLACRQTGGAADRVLLWPLGGLAFVAPPPRPGASLWTTVAGPLVNLVLAPFLVVLALITMPPELGGPTTDYGMFFEWIAIFNGFMLVFNLLPIFPMDGGRILQAFLWMVLGRSLSLAIAAWIGIVAGAGLCLLALSADQWWLAAIAGFLVLGAYGGVVQSRLIRALEQIPRRNEVACPNCDASPPRGEVWRCNRCLGGFDLFAPTMCPKGGRHVTDGGCLDCGRQLAPQDWVFRESVPAPDEL